MNLSKNYYSILGVNNKSDEKSIKKAYYKLSFTHHPDKNGDPIIFGEMTEAYDVLCGEQRKDYDVKSKFGRLDLLFNNAGIASPGSLLEEITPEDWQRVININIGGVFYCTQQAFALMKSQKPMGGRIINNGSISAHTPRPNSSAYTASKHAVTGLTKTASLDGRAFDIAVGQIDIGNADTDMAQPMRVGATQADGSKLIEPTIDPQHIADAVAFMASLPLSANVPFITVMATKMPYSGRG